MKTLKTTRRTNLGAPMVNLHPFRNATRSLQGGTVDAFARDCYGCTRGRLAGADLDQWSADIDDVDYVITSFATPIAWHTSRGWHLVDQRFSPTTSGHQSQVRRGLATIE
jgi:hypothetical protein